MEMELLQINVDDFEKKKEEFVRKSILFSTEV
jgi:hypothetical protein